MGPVAAPEPSPSELVVELSAGEPSEEATEEATEEAIEASPRRRQLGPYELIAELARGGMGVVYLGRRAGEAGFERLFAIKELHPHLARDHEFVAMLLDEARLAAQIHHHNVASVVELGHGEQGYYLVMPYIEGASLDQLLAQNPSYRPARLLVPILIGALGGLAAAHALEDDEGNAIGLVHRDVSPQNIMIGVDGDARITDFGIAKARARICSTEPGVVKGKLCYCAPELFERGAVDQRADVFAAGAVLWSALTGRSLFRGDTDAETMRRVLSLEVPAPSQVGLAPPAVFDAIILRALERDPERRFPTAAAMAEALREAALSAGLLGAPTQVARWVKESFEAQLAERRRCLRLAARDSNGVMILPKLGPAEPTPATASDPAARGLIGSTSAEDATRNLAPTEPRSSSLDLARFLAISALAFGAGVLAALWGRGLL